MHKQSWPDAFLERDPLRFETYRIPDITVANSQFGPGFAGGDYPRDIDTGTRNFAQKIFPAAAAQHSFAWDPDVLAWAYSVRNTTVAVSTCVWTYDIAHVARRFRSLSGGLASTIHPDGASPFGPLISAVGLPPQQFIPSAWSARMGAFVITASAVAARTISLDITVLRAS